MEIPRKKHGKKLFGCIQALGEKLRIYYIMEKGETCAIPEYTDGPICSCFSFTR